MIIYIVKSINVNNIEIITYLFNVQMPRFTYKCTRMDTGFDAPCPQKPDPGCWRQSACRLKYSDGCTSTNIARAQSIQITTDSSADKESVDV